MALRQVADLSGYNFGDGDEYQYKFIGSIVDRVSRVINRAPLHVADYPVGLLSHVLKVKKLLDVGSDDVVHMIGIHGMGGLGKTTLSLAVYNLIAADFNKSCFLQNVREESNKHGLKHLQTVLLSEILGEKDISLASVQRGISVIQQRLRRKKVLLILDDVDNRKQLQAFAGRSDWFGPGSRVIITTRDEQLLKSHEIERTYEVEELNENYSLQLLVWNAFKREKVDPSYEDVLKRVVTYASGLPLALEVIGSNLVGKSVEEWESAIEHYKRIPNGEILEILKVSFDGLGEGEKNVFLDIACCFKGSSLKEVESILGVLYDNNMKHHIRVLVEKSLIKIWGEIQMHDLIEDMGRHIDRQKSPEEPGKRRRLWLAKDILHVLKHNKGTSETEIICLDLLSMSEKEETLEWNANAFRRMKNLKILIIRNGKFSKGPNYFPESLRVLEWHGYPSNCLPSNFDSSKLVTCMLPHSHFTSFGFLGLSKKFENLTVLKFDGCKFLTQTPDMSVVGNLEEVSFNWCESLVAVHDSIGFMNKLKILHAQHCIKLMSFPPLNLPTLKSLELSFCSNLEKFPEILGKMGKIRVLELEGLPIKELPPSFQNLIGLEELYLLCKNVHLSSIIATMPNLYYFDSTNSKGWQWVKSEDAEDNVGSMVPSKVDLFSALSCDLDDNFFSTGFKGRCTYDVFLSFRGKDTRYGFIDNLYQALCNMGIHTFTDKELKKGEEIVPALQKAIAESRIAIVVLSHNYASSSFCLDELATILHCKSKGLLVIPVFYNVYPSYVRRQKGSYEKGLAELPKRFKAQKEKLHKWKMALRQVADLSGYYFRDGDEYQYKFIQRIVERVSTVINGTALDVANNPVGLLSQVLKVKKLLDVGSDDVVHMIGIL
ncbi:hypothetical protein VIGAN_11214200 [Vigna angularis var. angularis]|uniref:TIR domain-containing protein n=1 Tax=Vigna angularis var. angularis TaxID=157739 RepID=A0A0S3TCJ3_PHAAN|nr:hypothetical protein VIGAN_11214200 [Vigna angularis var. angularis]